ncbi:MAG: universal stress protein [Candidatus Eremiobacteraeota bacterium]|nr:universal stress protein [Candidatus Eremiobacteraeota bacterium]MBV8498799.1 universal stress protein [Candidatus Eremiobacteraeota bacterium]
MPNRILVPVDGSEFSNRALDFAATLATETNAEIVILNVVDLARVAVLSGGEAQLIPGCLEEVRAEGQRVVEDACARVRAPVHASARVVTGSPVDAIEEVAADSKPSFIVMGTHGRSGLGRALMGSVAEGVVRRAPVPVMIVPPERRP